jgi:hypothetical protein
VGFLEGGLTFAGGFFRRIFWTSNDLLFVKEIARHQVSISDGAREGGGRAAAGQTSRATTGSGRGDGTANNIRYSTSAARRVLEGM